MLGYFFLIGRAKDRHTSLSRLVGRTRCKRVEWERKKGGGGGGDFVCERGSLCSAVSWLREVEVMKSR